MPVAIFSRKASFGFGLRQKVRQTKRGDVGRTFAVLENGRSPNNWGTVEAILMTSSLYLNQGCNRSFGLGRHENVFNFPYHWSRLYELFSAPCQSAIRHDQQKTFCSFRTYPNLWDIGRSKIGSKVFWLETFVGIKYWRPTYNCSSVAVCSPSIYALYLL